MCSCNKTYSPIKSCTLKQKHFWSNFNFFYEGATLYLFIHFRNESELFTIFTHQCISTIWSFHHDQWPNVNIANLWSEGQSLIANGSKNIDSEFFSPRNSFHFLPISKRYLEKHYRHETEHHTNDTVPWLSYICELIKWPLVWFVLICHTQR